MESRSNKSSSPPLAALKSRAVIVKDDEAGRARAAEVIKGGGVIAFRTDTFYGLGADPFNQDALHRINELKGRDGKPILVVISDESEADFFISEKTAAFERVCKRHWPGALTIVMSARTEVPSGITAGSDSVGLRLPDDDGVRAFIRECGGKLTGTSANLAGEPPARTAEAVASFFPEGIDLIVDGGLTVSDKPSTVLDLTGSLPHLIREGVISRRELLDALNEAGEEI
jgi:L-threonylcarbamoyladenylate synthase